jgi:hypothetical protein
VHTFEHLLLLLLLLLLCLLLLLRSKCGIGRVLGSRSRERAGAPGLQRGRSWLMNWLIFTMFLTAFEKMLFEHAGAIFAADKEPVIASGRICGKRRMLIRTAGIGSTSIAPHSRSKCQQAIARLVRAALMRATACGGAGAWINISSCSAIILAVTAAAAAADHMQLPFMI